MRNFDMNYNVQCKYVLNCIHAPSECITTCDHLQHNNQLLLSCRRKHAVRSQLFKVKVRVWVLYYPIYAYSSHLL